MKLQKRQQPKKTSRLKLVAKRPQKLKAALKAWGSASDKICADPFGLDGAPRWAEKALVEVVRIVMPRRKLPDDGEWDAEIIGEIFGRLLAFGKLYSGEIPLGAEMTAECERLKELAARQPQSRERTVREKRFVEDLRTRIMATEMAIPELVKAVLASSHEDCVKFQRGFVRGMNVQGDDLAASRTFLRHTRIFWILGTKWKAFSKFRSVAQVHRVLCQALGEKNVGSLKTFESRIAGKIGMKLGQRGRPRKAE